MESEKKGTLPIPLQGLTLSTVSSSGTSDIDRRTSASVQLLLRLTSGIIRCRVITGPVRSLLLKKIGSDLQGIYSSEPSAGCRPTPTAQAMKIWEPIAWQSSSVSS